MVYMVCYCSHDSHLDQVILLGDHFLQEKSAVVSSWLDTPTQILISISALLYMYKLRWYIVQTFCHHLISQYIHMTKFMKMWAMSNILQLAPIHARLCV